MEVEYPGQPTRAPIFLRDINQGDCFKFPGGTAIYMKAAWSPGANPRSVLLSTGMTYCHPENREVVPIKAKVVVLAEGPD